MKYKGAWVVFVTYIFYIKKSLHSVVEGLCQSTFPNTVKNGKYMQMQLGIWIAAECCRDRLECYENSKVCNGHPVSLVAPDTQFWEQIKPKSDLPAVISSVHLLLSFFLVSVKGQAQQQEKSSV